jgi:hypothetical protein
MEKAVVPHRTQQLRKRNVELSSTLGSPPRTCTCAGQSVTPSRVHAAIIFSRVEEFRSRTRRARSEVFCTTKKTAQQPAAPKNARMTHPESQRPLAEHDRERARQAEKISGKFPRKTARS